MKINLIYGLPEQSAPTKSEDGCVLQNFFDNSYAALYRVLDYWGAQLSLFLPPKLIWSPLSNRLVSEFNLSFDRLSQPTQECIKQGTQYTLIKVRSRKTSAYLPVHVAVDSN